MGLTAANAAVLPHWRTLMRPGDWLTLLLGVGLCALAVAHVASAGAPEKAVVRAGGRIVAELPLTRAQTLEVPGPLGSTRIEVEPGRARVAADPGPRQYCVRQGWLTRANSVAICAPNEVSLSLAGGRRDYDSLGY